MKHRFWIEHFWKDLGHCLCCPCGEGVFPLGGAEGIGGFCKYGKDCKQYSNTMLFLKTLTGHFVAWEEDDYEKWVRFRAKRAIQKGNR